MWVQLSTMAPSFTEGHPPWSTCKILSVGLVNGRNAWRCELEQALVKLRPARERFGENLWVSTLATGT